MRGTGTAWGIGAVQDTVQVEYRGGTLNFANTTELMAGYLLQADLDFFAALRIFEKIICQYVHPIRHWETGQAWKLTIPITASYGAGGGTGSIGPVTWGPMPIGDIETAIRPLPAGWNCLSWDEIKQFLCENNILPPELCAVEGEEPATGLAGNCVANDNLGETADSFISRCRLASIRREFPAELLGETLGTIKRGKSAKHRKAWKLLNDGRFKKPGAGATVVPGPTVGPGTPTGPCHVPVNYRQTVGRDDGGGVLSFEYAWDSSSGRDKLDDLKDCEVGEHVSYPGPNPFPWPKPPWNTKTPIPR